MLKRAARDQLAVGRLLVVTSAAASGAMSTPMLSFASGGRESMELRRKVTILEAKSVD